MSLLPPSLLLFLQDIEVTTEKDHNLMSTLLVSTVYPEEGRRSTFVEVATIKSPYSFSFEDGMSTRYVNMVGLVGSFHFVGFSVNMILTNKSAGLSP